jgi:hypothetical protein
MKKKVRTLKMFKKNKMIGIKFNHRNKSQMMICHYRCNKIKTVIIKKCKIKIMEIKCKYLNLQILKQFKLKNNHKIL